MISIIIPAHNEAQLIAATLTPLLPGIDSGEFEVIVVCNACTDNTAELVRGISDRIICLEDERASKTNALNRGDAHARYFPRIYLDADIRISTVDIRALSSALDDGRLLAVSPSMHMDISRSSWPVRAYYEVWEKLPYCREGLIGVGAYALSAAGRVRFDSFPDIIADDTYVRLHFSPEERGAVAETKSIVNAPTGLTGLVRIKTRSRLGEYELKAKFPELYVNDNKAYSSAVLGWLLDWRTMPKVIVYMLVNVLTRLRATIQSKRNGYSGWERDYTSRSSHE